MRFRVEMPFSGVLTFETDAASELEALFKVETLASELTVMFKHANTPVILEVADVSWEGIRCEPLTGQDYWFRVEND